jgi:hypothetical protein
MKMNKISKQKTLLTTALFILLLISATFSLLPNAKATTISQASQEKTNTILNNVLNIDTADYSVTLNSQTDKYGPLEKSLTDITLTANKTSVRLSASFVNDTLQMLLLSEYTGNFAETKPASATVDMAKDFLVNYRAYSGDSFYSTLAQTLNDPTVINNVTKTSGNVMLKVSNYEQKIVDYVWTYVDENGVTARVKNVCLSYDQGRLSSFLNNWPLYKIADTQITISQEQAVKIALAAAENYTYQININNATSTVSVAGFHFNPESLSMAALSYVNCPTQSSARDSSLTLYPSWCIPLGFDRAYPADVTGVSVRIWAETGELLGMTPMTFDGAYEASTGHQSRESSFAVYAPVSLGLILCVAALFVSRKRILTRVGANKLGNPKFWSLLFCLTILSGFTFATVDADPMTSSRIYAALFGGQGSPPQMETEVIAIENTTNYMFDYFDGNNEFDVSNQICGGTTKEDILEDIAYDKENYDSAVVFHFGHMKYSALMDPGYVDNYGDVIMPSDISSQTEDGRHRFVFLWVCDQVRSGASSGMVQAWLPGIISSNGIVMPDDSGKCFIGFDGTSPLIAQYTNPPALEFDTTFIPLQYFIEIFYRDTIVYGTTVWYALNDASLQILDAPFTSSKLYDGWRVWWPNDDGHRGYQDCQMIVCGNANIHLWQYMRTLSISSSEGGYTDPAAWQGWECTCPRITAIPDSGYEFSGWTIDGNPTNDTNEILDIKTIDSHTVHADFSPYQPYHSLTVTGWCNSIWGEVYPEVWIYDDDTDTTWYDTAPVTFYDLPNRDLQITVAAPQYPYTNMEFSCMNYERGIVYYNPDTILLNGDYHLTAYFYLPM